MNPEIEKIILEIEFIGNETNNKRVLEICQELRKLLEDA